MNAGRVAFLGEIAALIEWEKRKRREATLVTALFFALVAALAVPLFIAIPRGWGWATPIACFALAAPCLLFARRWSERDSVRALAALDRSLGLAERATTARDLLRREDTRAVALLVLREASERVKGIDARALFPRSPARRNWLLVPLFGLWLGLYLFEARFEREPAAPPPSVPQELREFARRLQEKARGESLPRTLESARELERLARRALDSGGDDETFRRELAATARKLAAEGKAAGHAAFGATESRRQLEDLRAELTAARGWLDAPGGAAESWQDRLAGLTELSRHWAAPDRGGRKLTREEMQAFLDRLEERVTAELDRRALLETERYLRELGERGQGREDAGGPAGEREDAVERRREGKASAPGEKPGSVSGGASPPPEYRVAERSAAKGSPGEGERSSIVFKGRPVAGKSTVAEDDVVARYRRRAEADLEAERIPGELKDAIRAYFLSLDRAQ